MHLIINTPNNIATEIVRDKWLCTSLIGNSQQLIIAWATAVNDNIYINRQFHHHGANYESVATLANNVRHALLYWWMARTYHPTVATLTKKIDSLIVRELRDLTKNQHPLDR